MDFMDAIMSISDGQNCIIAMLNILIAVVMLAICK